MPQPELTPEESSANAVIAEEFVESMREYVKGESEGLSEVMLALRKDRVVKAAINYARTTNMSYFDEIAKSI